jgi:hypothetical protein
VGGGTRPQHLPRLLLLLLLLLLLPLPGPPSPPPPQLAPAPSPTSGCHSDTAADLDYCCCATPL